MTNYANSLRKLTASTAVATLLAAGAAQAQDAGVGADVAAGADVSVGTANTSADAGAGVGADVNVNTPGTSVAAGAGVNADTSVAGTVGAANASDTATANAAKVEVDVSVAPGAVAVASDQTVLGTISQAEPQADGSVRYSIDLTDDLVAGSDEAVVQIEQEVDADGQLVIGMTGEEFAAALTQKLDAGAAGQTQTN